ncbi:MAG: hypothetical protein EAX95_12925 [Candidatus Thorarchaeota archaeon]|nr:hypothetical protein [Candidatus Thorarchaeota archaeon]
MTVRSQMKTTTAPRPKAQCGRAGCIVLYKGDNCIFCDAALETLNAIVCEFGLPSNSVYALDADEYCDDFSPGFPGPMGLPTIRICREILVGMPDPDNARGAILHAAIRECFLDNTL